MATEGTETGWDRRAAVLIIAAAVILTALLQLIVFEQYSDERLATLAIIVVLFAVTIWAYAGGYGWATNAWRNWRLRRHIRSHPEMVAALHGLIIQVEEVLGERSDRFGSAARAVILEWRRVSQTVPPPAQGPVFNDAERQQIEIADRAMRSWGTHAQDWAVARNMANYLLSDVAKRDGLAYLYAAWLIRSYISSSLTYLRDFTLAAQQSGMSKIGQIPLSGWATFARTVNDLLRSAREIDQFGPEKVGFGLDLKFDPVVENLAMAASGSNGTSEAPT